jgi:hypothetical protein
VNIEVDAVVAVVEMEEKKIDNKIIVFHSLAAAAAF